MFTFIDPMDIDETNYLNTSHVNVYLPALLEPAFPSSFKYISC